MDLTTRLLDGASGSALALATRAGQSLNRALGRHAVLAMPPQGSDLRPVIGDPGVAKLGYSLDFVGDRPALFQHFKATYGDVTWTTLLGERCVMVLSPDGIQQVLLNTTKSLSQSGWDWAIGPFFDRGLMLLDADEHLFHRRVMQAAFTNAQLDGYVAGINDVAARTMDRWQPGRLSFYDAYKQLTLDIATQVFMGEELSAEETARIVKAFYGTVQAGTSIVRAGVPGGRWHAGLRGRKVLEEFFRSRIPAARARDGQDLFSALCHATTDDGEVFSDADVVNHMIFLLMAAHDTTTASTASLVHELGRAPQWQERLRVEVDALGTDDLGREQMAKLPTMEAAIKESQRLITPVPVLFRRATDDLVVEGHHVPGGTLVMAVPMHVHGDARYWPEPDVFDPDRFGEEPTRVGEQHRYAWIPFGGGVHKCIGMHFGNLEVSVSMHHLLRRFSWSVPDDYRMPVSHEALPYPADGLPITLHAR